MCQSVLSPAGDRAPKSFPPFDQFSTSVQCCRVHTLDIVNFSFPFILGLVVIADGRLHVCIRQIPQNRWAKRSRPSSTCRSSPWHF